MNRPTAFLLLFLLTISVALLSCGECSKKIDCPGYTDDTLDAWFPYQDNQRLIFVSNNNTVDTFTLKNTKTTAPYQAAGGVYGPGPQCEARKTFQSLQTDSQQGSRFNANFLSYNSTRYANFTIGKNHIGITGLGSEGTVRVNTGSRDIIPQIRPAVTINNRTFTNIMEAVGDTTHTKNAGIYKVYFSKGEGLVAFSEFPSLQTWVKQ